MDRAYMEDAIFKTFISTDWIQEHNVNMNHKYTGNVASTKHRNIFHIYNLNISFTTPKGLTS